MDPKKAIKEAYGMSGCFPQSTFDEKDDYECVENKDSKCGNSVPYCGENAVRPTQKPF